MHSSLPIDASDFDAIIFDLGGVILHLDYQRTVAQLSQLVDQDVSALYSQIKQKTLFDEYERGALDSAGFQRGLIQLLPGHHTELLARLNDADFCEAFDQGWNAMLLSIPNESLQLLKRLKSQTRVYLLSNTNNSHLTQFLKNYERDHLSLHGPFEAHFHATYYSHQLGQRKPEPRIFETVLTQQGLDASRTLFIDDNIENLAGAQSLGLNVVHHPTNTALCPRFI